MKKMLMTLTLAAGLCAAVVWLPDACGQNSAATARAGKATNGSRIAFIDLFETMRNYKKSQDLSDRVRSTAEMAGAKDKQMKAQIQEKGMELQKSELDQESREYLQKEKTIIQSATSHKMFQAMSQKEIKKEEAKASLAIYQDVAAAAQQFAEQNGYTLVLQIDHEGQAAKDYKTVAQSLEQRVMRHSAGDDITNSVIAYLNKQYEEAGGAEGLAGESPVKNSPSKSPSSAKRKAPAR